MLSRTILLENPSTYVTFESSDMTEIEFLTSIVQLTGCGLLLDVNNAYVSAVNHDFDAGSWGINASDATIPMTFDFRFRSTSQSNEPGLRDPRMDAILDDLNKARTDADYRSVFDRMLALWIELVPVVSYATVEQVTLFEPEIKGATYSYGSVVLWDKAYIEE